MIVVKRSTQLRANSKNVKKESELTMKSSASSFGVMIDIFLVEKIAHSEKELSKNKPPTNVL